MNQFIFIVDANVTRDVDSTVTEADVAQLLAERVGHALELVEIRATKALATVTPSKPDATVRLVSVRVGKRAPGHAANVTEVAHEAEGPAPLKGPGWRETVVGEPGKPSPN